MDSPDKYNNRQLSKGLITGATLSPLVELWQREHGLVVDSKLGQRTLESILLDEVVEGDTDPLIKIWDAFDGPLPYIPRDRKDVYKVFGNPSNGPKVDNEWRRENIRTFRKDMALPGVDPHRYVKLHKLAEPYIREALRRASQVSDYEITHFGDFNYRLMRSASRLSYHAFGIAFDINHEDNSPRRYRLQREAPTPWGDEWYKLWPQGMDRAFVDAIKSVGFGWGGDWRTFKDPMHFELVMP